MFKAAETNQIILLCLFTIFAQCCTNRLLCCKLAVCVFMEVHYEKKINGSNFSGNDGNAYCHASGSAGAATKFVVRGTLHKYADNGHLDKICNWPNITTYGQTFIFDEHALMVTPGKYLFTLYVDVYNGTQCENLVFTKTNTK